MRWLIILHRYVGIAVGWLLVAWCVSGIVMMYVAYPSLSLERYLELRPALDFSGCCRTGGLDAAEGLPIADFSIEMLLGQATARIADAFGGEVGVSLATGTPVEPIDRAKSLAVATASVATGAGGTPRYLGAAELDQWTIAEYRPGQTLHHIALDDAAGTEWYVAAGDGRLVQETTRAQRFWNWLGPVTHWIYPTLLRRHVAIWANVVIWSSIVGLFLAGFGIYLGIARFGRRPNGRHTPFRGLMLWHHYAGLVFGGLTLTWLFSGLLSMNPWGMLESAGAGAEAARLGDAEMTVADIEAWIGAIAAHPWPRETVSIRTAALLGKPYLLIYGRDGAVERVDPTTMTAAPLGERELAEAAERLADGRAIESATLLEHEDAFYYSHHETRPLPVYRVVLDDTEHTRYYLDPASGALLGKVDSSARWYRWLFAGLHRLDFAAAFRQRPAWDLLMLGLLGGVTAVCFTGTYLGVRVLRRR